jgi:hypothetical protein
MAALNSNNTYFASCEPAGEAATKCTYDISGKTWTLQQDITLTGIDVVNACITLGPGETFDGGNYTILVHSAGQVNAKLYTSMADGEWPSIYREPGVFKILAGTNVGPKEAHDELNTDKCTIKNLCVDQSANTIIDWYHGGFIQDYQSNTGGLGIHFKNCITKRVRCSQAVGKYKSNNETSNNGSGGFTGGNYANGSLPKHNWNITYENCIVVWDANFDGIQDIVSTTDDGAGVGTDDWTMDKNPWLSPFTEKVHARTFYVEGGLGGWNTGNNRPQDVDSGIRQITAIGCISYVEVDNTTTFAEKLFGTRHNLDSLKLYSGGNTGRGANAFFGRGLNLEDSGFTGNPATNAPQQNAAGAQKMFDCQVVVRDLSKPGSNLEFNKGTLLKNGEIDFGVINGVSTNEIQWPYTKSGQFGNTYTGEPTDIWAWEWRARWNNKEWLQNNFNYENSGQSNHLREKRPWLDWAKGTIATPELVRTISFTKFKSSSNFFNLMPPTAEEALVEAAAAAQALVADAAETKAITLSISTANITSIKAMVPGSTNNGKASASAAGGNTLRSIMDTAGTGPEKRKRRRAALKLMFAQSTFSAVTKMVFEKADLVLPAAFDASKVLVIKAGQTFVIGDLSDNEGFYSVLDDGEKVSYTISDDSTVTFTRNDVGDNEQYDLSGGDVINVDKVTAGTLDSSGNGHLEPGDIVGIDGRDFFIGSVGDGGGSGSGGDPYVYPINSSVPVKLPNKRANYRMFEQGNNYINVEVKRATQDHRDRMLSYAEMITHETHNIVCDGFFYHKAFISAEGHTLLIDYMSKKMSCSAGALDFFTIKQIKKKFTEGEFGDDCKCMKIAWKTKEGKKIHAEIMFFPNPHIENGINVIPETTRGSTGLIVTNYKPKLMKLPSITTLKYDKLHRRLANTKNVFQKKAIKGKNEKWHLKK